MSEIVIREAVQKLHAAIEVSKRLRTGESVTGWGPEQFIRQAIYELEGTYQSPTSAKSEGE